MCLFFCFFFKQKTAYELRISDWSSDVCSSDLRELFEQAAAAAPSIIFIDEIDSIAPKRQQVTGEAEKRLVAQLLSLMDGIEPRQNLVVIAATNRPEADRKSVV